MKRYFIDYAKFGYSWPESVVATAKYNDGESDAWITMIDTGGIPDTFVTDRDVHEEVVETNVTNEAFQSYMRDHEVFDFNGLVLGEYADIMGSIRSDPDNPAVPLIRYLVALVRSDNGVTDGTAVMRVGRYADEMDIPKSDVEKLMEEE